MPGQLTRWFLLFARALRLRCPNCGQGQLFTSWFGMRERCPVCGLKTERGEEGYQVGSYMFNIVASEFLFLGLFIAAIVLTWPTPPWSLIQYGGIGLMILAPFAFFPLTKTLFLAFDLVFRPATPDELVTGPSDSARAP